MADVSTAVLEGGEGPPVVLLHGGIECGGVYWAPVVSRLAERHRLVVPDTPGLGESEPVTRFDAAFAEWFAALLQQTCDQEPTLIAHSLLGGPAAGFAAGHGDLLRRLVLYAAPAVGRYRPPMRFRVAAIRLGLRQSERNSERFARWAFRDLDETRRRDRDWYEAFDAYSRSRGAVPHVKRTMRQLIKAGTKQIPDHELRRIAIPTVLLWGRHDRMVPLGLAEVASRRSGWPLQVIDGAGHVPHIEQPNAFLQALSEIEPASCGGR